jgi:hypothetical protein
MASLGDQSPLLPDSVRAKLAAWFARILGYVLLAACMAGAASLLTWSLDDPSYMRATDAPARNLFGPPGATFADLTLRLLGLAGVFVLLPPMFWALQMITRRQLDGARLKLTLAPLAVLLLAAAASSLPRVAAWPIPFGLGGFLGDQALQALRGLTAVAGPERAAAAAGVASLGVGLILLIASLGLSLGDLKVIWRDRSGPRYRIATWAWVPETVREGEFDAAAADLECHDMAKRFAPEPPAPEASSNIDTPRFRLRRAPNPSADLQGDLQPDADPEREVRRARGPTRRFSPFRPAVPKSKAEQEPIWPGSAPAPPAEVLPDGPRRHPPGEELYNRAVAIVRADRKTSTEYLKERLGIRYMRAADLIDRMEQEGVLGAPVRNGTRPILRRMPRSRIV